MLNRILKRSNDVRNAHEIYGSIVTMTRAPALYSDIGVPDTLEKRFELLMLHMFIFLTRLNERKDDAAALRQSLVDCFFEDVEATSRQVGVGDLSVPKKMRQMAAVFSGRMNDYKVAMSGDNADEGRALLKEIFDDGQTAALDVEALQSYVSELLAADDPLMKNDLERGGL